jgi:sterol 14-demethylase
MSEAPELFQVDDEGNLKVLQENPNLAFLEMAKQAEKYCPNKAIKIEMNHGDLSKS